MITLAQLLKLAHAVRTNPASAGTNHETMAIGLSMMFAKAPPQESRAVAEGGWVNACGIGGCFNPKLARAVARGLLEAADEADAQVREQKTTKRGVGRR